MELSVVLSIASGIITLLMGVLLGLLKWSVDGKEKDYDRRFAEVKSDTAVVASRIEAAKAEVIERASEKASSVVEDIKGITSRLHIEELASEQLRGKLALTEHSTAAIVADVEEIKRSMITKTEFEMRMNNNDKMLALILQRVDKSSYSSSPAMTATRPTPNPDRGR